MPTNDFHTRSTLNTTNDSASKANSLPDVSIDLKPEFYAKLSRVGMRAIEMPVRLVVQGREMTAPARLEAFVSLDDPEAKGIHMSRLYLETKSQLESSILDGQGLHELLKRFLKSHVGLSNTAEIKLSFELPVKRKALVSDLEGYRSYPVRIKATLQNAGEFKFELECDILYSSTCPCSAALARELMREDFKAAFAGQGFVDSAKVEEWIISPEFVMATPHAQRSLARVKVKLPSATASRLSFDFVVGFIDSLEAAVGTPVQSAVKRVDEQMFARLNGENLMFCEDAARKLRFSLEADANILDYDIYVEHQESLHPHDAVSRVVKGVDGGYEL